MARGRCAECCLLTFLLVSAVSGAHAELPRIVPAKDRSPDSVREITVQPRRIVLSAVSQQQQVLVTGETTDGAKVDLTRDSLFSIEDESIADISAGMLTGKTDGETRLLVRFGTHEQSVPLVIQSFDQFPPVDFVNDIIPVFSKLGCNSGGCHGKASGQAGFKLSVFGFDPESDFAALTRETRGRRVSSTAPDQSLLLRKAMGTVPHGGGRRLRRDSSDYQVLLQWIRQGRRRRVDPTPKLMSIRVLPDVRTVNPGKSQQLQVTAHYDDGTSRDVTRMAAYSSNAEFLGEVDSRGLVRIGDASGEVAVTVNYRGLVAATRLLIPRPGNRQWIEPPVRNRIDRLVWEKLRQLGIQPSAAASDEVLLRRMLLKTIGTMPTVSEIEIFRADRKPGRRRRLIERTLDRTEFADYWAMLWADVLLVDRNTIGSRGAFQFHQWLRQQMASDRPYDQWVHELIVASGNSGKVGPVNFFRAARTPDGLTRSVSQAFLGIRLDCAQCHHHPFDRWGQEDFYGLAGFFTGLRFQKLSGDREVVYHGSTQPARMPLTDTLIPIRPPGGEPLLEQDETDPRLQLADWITSPGNPYFTHLVANRVWSQLMGRGLVEPIDDLRATNPSTNEPLLNHLAEYLASHEYRLQSLVAYILDSEVFGLSSETNDSNRTDAQNFSHFPVTRMPAEVLLDAVSQVTAVPERFPGKPPGTRSIQLWDNRLPSYFLDTFGRSPRESPCECGRSGEPTMAQALHLMNAPEIEKRIGDDTGRAARLAASRMPNDAIVEQLTLVALGREPSEREHAVAVRLFAESDRRRATEDYLWVLLNSYDFLFVH